MRTGKRRKRHARRPDRVWGIDMTKIMVPSCGWMYLTVVLDGYTKKIVGYDLAPQSRAEDCRRALQQAVKAQFPEGIHKGDERLRLVSDNGSQPTVRRFMEDCSALKIKQIFTRYNNPKGNADTERVMLTIKEDLAWPNEFLTIEALVGALKRGVHFYSHKYPHFAIGYPSPCEYERRQRQTA